jgi:hypothetical protein
MKGTPPDLRIKLKSTPFELYIVCFSFRPFDSEFHAVVDVVMISRLTSECQTGTERISETYEDPQILVIEGINNIAIES